MTCHLLISIQAHILATVHHTNTTTLINYYGLVTCELPSLQAVPLAGSIFKILTSQRDKIKEDESLQ